jgi:hypothetical protein
MDLGRFMWCEKRVILPLLKSWKAVSWIDTPDILLKILCFLVQHSSLKPFLQPTSHSVHVTLYLHIYLLFIYSSIICVSIHSCILSFIPVFIHFVFVVNMNPYPCVTRFLWGTDSSSMHLFILVYAVILLMILLYCYHFSVITIISLLSNNFLSFSFCFCLDSIKLDL